MSDGGGGKKRGKSEEIHENEERWLLTYADMITLLMALFIIMWAISVTNTSKYEALRQSLSAAFTGKVVDGGNGVLNGGPQLMNPQGLQIQNIQRPSPSQSESEASMSIAPQIKQPVGSSQAEAQNLQSIADRIRKYAKDHGLQNQVSAQVDERGVVIRLLTDKILFDSGSADLKSQAIPLISNVGHIIENVKMSNPIRVEGNTDSRPIATARYRSNWELSTGRAVSVLQVLLAAGATPARLSAAGYADTHPVASNLTDTGRYMNRHVDIVVIRNDGAATTIASVN